ncbi:MAG: hypothetical protein RMK92_00310 [Armatimonadota bacterium]|nr:hypothetical protein [Armatimonadota bacterium]
MTTSQREQILEAIERLEREIEHLRKLVETQETEETEQDGIPPSTASALTTIEILVQAIAEKSSGGSSVEEIRQERERP